MKDEILSKEKQSAAVPKIQYDVIAMDTKNKMNTTGSVHHPKLQSIPPTTYYTTKTQYITNTYPTTIFLVLFLHLYYFYQYKKRKSYNNACCSYNIIVKEYKFYRIFTSMISYYPSSINHHDNGDDDDELRSLPTENEPTTTSSNSIIRQTMRDIILEPFQAPNILSGFPLLMYTSHILWSIRALETQFTSLLYLRFIIFMIIFHTLFYCFYYKYRISSFRFSSLGNAPWMTMTSIMITLVSFFKYQYPFINIQIVPFVLYTTTWYNQANDSFLSVMIYMIEYFLCCGTFHYLSKSRHSHGCFFGYMISCMTFPTWGLWIYTLKTNVYWFNCIFAWVFIVCLLSIKHADNDGENDTRRNRRLGNPWIPCIDYVSWSSSNQQENLQDVDEEQTETSQEQQQQQPVNPLQEEEGEEDEFLSFNHAANNTSSSNTTQDFEYQPRETSATTTARSRARHHASGRSNRDNAMNGTTLGYSLPDSHDSD